MGSPAAERPAAGPAASELVGYAAGGKGMAFGETPLPQTVAAAATIRRLTGILLALEHADPAVDDITRQIDAVSDRLEALLPADPRPRIGDEQSADRRIYLDHSMNIGAYNPAFPEFAFTSSEPDRATGTVTFPLNFEGPPGLVHGGFLGVFFDSVMQQHNCQEGLAGKTRSLNVRYRRPTPLLRELEFDIARTEHERGLLSTGRLLLDDEVLAIGEMDAVAMNTDNLITRTYGRRRPAAGTAEQA
ncbi:hypothetical protein M2359_004365 [Gordonia amarae]|uniref:Thioesterase domain-containing protein n=2 Tax=Gordonia amarae TaxID=36821 RepID=G7GMN3_9ACTN|nr:hypothetical protein [Gordonia amarae]MCS3880736.1 hypothetical protein [Gordonia amarae]GAB04872.1 hypothetical protein GOAMR_23_00300 [Gordonia amarae NBRC 15530]